MAKKVVDDKALQAAMNWRTAAGMSKRSAESGARAELRRARGQAEIKALEAVSRDLKRQGY